jgi:uncharacterized delta-60 repeat protein
VESSNLAAGLPPGSLDPTFGGDGLVTTTINNVDYAYAVAVQADGKIVVAGCADDSIDLSDSFALVRYNRNGLLDSGFGEDGRVVTSFGYDACAYALAIQDDGKVVAGGYTGIGSNFDGFALARYNGDGSLDTGFDTDGKVITDPGILDGYISAIAIQPDGKIVAVGKTSDSSDKNNIAVVRTNSDGSLDTSFDGDGIVTTLIRNSSSGTSVALQPDGKIVVGGASYNPDSKIDFSIVRYNSDGSLD